MFEKKNLLPIEIITFITHRKTGTHLNHLPLDGTQTIIPISDLAIYPTREFIFGIIDKVMQQFRTDGYDVRLLNQNATVDLENVFKTYYPDCEKILDWLKIMVKNKELEPEPLYVTEFDVPDELRKLGILILPRLGNTSTSSYKISNWFCF